MKQEILRADRIVKSFSKETEPVLDGISLSIYRGDCTVIMGASGSGKSTLLYMLSGMDGFDSGSVRYQNRALEQMTEKEMAALRTSEFGFVFQQANLVSHLTLFENVAVAGYLEADRSGRETDQRAMELLEMMHVEHAGGRIPSMVSGGEAQRAAIARAVINSPKILFADEPTGALNRRNSEEVMDILTSLNKEGQSVMLVTHDIKAAVRGNRILYLEDGKIPDELELSAFEAENSKEREERITQWLAGLSW